jgi:hypothetical protein
MNVNEHHLVAEKEFGQFMGAHPPIKEIRLCPTLLDEDLNPGPAEAVDVFLPRQPDGGEIAVLFEFEQAAVQTFGMAMNELAHLAATQKAVTQNESQNLNVVASKEKTGGG